jgi:NADPH:quinone reductase-like Zn-dependent oxidoreductase
MKAALITGPGQGPILADFQDPKPAPGDHLITVSAAAISHVVKSRASGTHYSASGQFPFIPGIDGIGITESGNRVYFVLPEAPFGSMAERVAVPAAHCVPVPDDLDDVTAAALANPGLSSWAAYVERAKLRPGETVLVNGATGTSGRLAVQIAKHLGAGKVIATGRNQAALAEIGADITLSLEEDFRPFFAEGIDVVIDYLWGKSAEALLIAAAKAGPEARPIRFVQVGAISGGDITLPSAVLRSSAIELMGSGIGSVRLERLIACIGDLLLAAPAAGFKIAVTPVPLSEVEQAWPKDDGQRRTVFLIGDQK